MKKPPQADRVSNPNIFLTTLTPQGAEDVSLTIQNKLFKTYWHSWESFETEKRQATLCSFSCFNRPMRSQVILKTRSVKVCRNAGLKTLISQRVIIFKSFLFVNLKLAITQKLKF
jgi:hypothetical protein